MIRLTVLYNLPDGADEEQFLSWRLSDNQQANESMPGVVRTDFARITNYWPEGSMPAYRFQTTVEWADRETFESSFHDEAVQAKLKENLRRVGDHSFFVSDVLIDSGG